jgi:hypothetical protein
VAGYYSATQEALGSGAPLAVYARDAEQVLAKIWECLRQALDNGRCADHEGYRPGQKPRLHASAYGRLDFSVRSLPLDGGLNCLL